GAQVRVGVLDTKLFPQQPDLRGRYFAQRDSLIETSEPWPWWAGHATFVAGLIACEAPAAELHVRSVLSSPSGEAALWDAVRRPARPVGGHGGRPDPVVRLLHRRRGAAARAATGDQPAHPDRGPGRGGRQLRRRLGPRAAGQETPAAGHAGLAGRLPRRPRGRG